MQERSAEKQKRPMLTVQSTPLGLTPQMQEVLALYEQSCLPNWVVRLPPPDLSPTGSILAQKLQATTLTRILVQPWNTHGGAGCKDSYIEHSFVHPSLPGGATVPNQDRSAGFWVGFL